VKKDGLVLILKRLTGYISVLNEGARTMHRFRLSRSLVQCSEPRRIVNTTTLCQGALLAAEEEKKKRFNF